MTQKSADLRVRRTRKMLQQALIDLTSEKGFAHVTVQDITERAMVNRSTFYRHYLDKYDLLQQYIEELYALMDARAVPADSPGSAAPAEDEPPAGLVPILEQVQQHADFFRGLLSEKGDARFCAQSFRKFLEKRFSKIELEEAKQTHSKRPPLDMSMSYVVQAGMGAIVWWLENDRPSSPEQVALWLNQLSRANIDLSIKSTQAPDHQER